MSFYDSAESSLGIISHAVCLVKDYKLKLRDVSSVWVFGNFSLRKLLYFLSDDLNTSLVRSIEFEDALSVKVLSEQLLCKCEYC